MEIEQAIDILKTADPSWPFNNKTILGDAINIAISALRAQQIHENPQPLTLDELKERVGKPVWIYRPKARIHKIECAILNDYVETVYGFTRIGITSYRKLSETFSDSELGKTMFLYDHEPKEAQHE